MDAEEAAAKLASLNAELAAKSSRISELEARVSFLEAENARLTEALASREAPGRTGAGDPKSGRLAAGSGGSEHEEAGKAGGSASFGIIEVSDDEDGAAVDANKGRSPEEGVVAAPTPRKRVVTSESEDEADLEGAVGGGGSSKEDGGAGLEDEDVSVTPRGKRRAAALVVTSDSEDEDVNGGELGSGEDGVGDQEAGATASRKRGLCGISDSDDEDASEGVPVAGSKAASGVVLPAQVVSDDEDDLVPIRQVLREMRKRVAREDDSGDELREARGCSTPTTRRSARLAKSKSKGGQVLKKRRKERVSEDDTDDESCEARERSTPTTRRSARLAKSKSKGGRTSRQVNKFVEPNEYEGSEDDMEEDSDTDGFIKHDSSSESDIDSAEEPHNESDGSGLNEDSSPGPEESDPMAEYASAMARIGRKKETKDWKFEADMLAAFAEHPELCLKAVCALYRRQTQEEQLEKAALVHNKEGFNHIDAHRGSCIAEFLLDGDREGPVMKTIHDLEEHDCCALEFCRRVASNYSKQLFAIYQNKEDPYFHP
ncbi:unnamed protein product [Urochloa decumbens]|uniref:Uncharacterized protein n=1 Tax=Urochloa decumbens TaxID=240449 RepID=A0ABC8ZBE6_9POAL